MKSSQRGFSLIELLGALAVGAIMMVGVSVLIDASMDDTKGQQAAFHQSQVTAAASKYINARYADLVAASTATTPAAPITVAMLKADGYLSAGLSDTNAYGQTPCVLVLQPAPGRLDALVVTEGGVAIPDKSIAYVAANAGLGGGYLSDSSGALTAVGAFGSTTVANVTLSNYLSTRCTSTTAADGHLASSLFFDGANRLGADFLYRGAVPGRPELNEMNTPLRIRLTPEAVENQSDTNCTPTPANNQTWGGIAVNSAGVILSCQSGIWRRQGSRFWRDPVLNFDNPNGLPATDNNVGDVRMVTSLNRAFTWNGTAWVALAVDKDGNLTVPGTLTAGTVNATTVTAGTVSADKLNLTQTVTKDTACTPNGALSRDSTGMVLTCKSGFWRSLLDTRITGSTKILDTTYTGGTGNRNFYLALPPVTGGPQYISGFTHCNSNGGTRVMAAIEVFDANNTRLGYNGGCGAQSEAGGRVLNKGFIPLAKLPQNSALIRVYAEPGSLASDYALIELYIFSSE